MMRGLLFLSALFFSANAAAAPVVVELFTSEGCSSCPPAEAFLNEIDEKARAQNESVYVIAYHVDYWNYLGWTDRFSQRAFSQRQRRVAKRLKVGVYTPQMVVGGDDVFVGSHASTAKKAIAKARAEVSDVLDVKTVREGAKIRVSSSGEGKRTYVLVMNDLRTKVKSGENKGRTLVHRGVAVALKETTKSEVSFDVPKESKDSLSVVVYAEKGGVIVASGRGDVR